jgi:LmbE family N-acetylglucosaminyl deacetylase
MKNVIVISAHPDDEVLGAGGTLLRHKSKGDKICWVIITCAFERQGFTAERITRREEEIKLVAQRLGVGQVVRLDYPTMELDSTALITMVPKISKVFTNFQPEIIYAPNRSDAHSDHRIVFDVVMACTKSFRYPFIRRILCMEVLSETEFAPALPEKVFIPNYFVDISDHLDEKIEIMKIYFSELEEHPFPRSVDNIRALATYRGASVGGKAAEAFQLLKYIER